PLSALEKQSASEVSVAEVKPIPSDVSAKSEYKSEEESEEVIRKKITFFIKWSWKMIILGVLLIGVYIFYKEFYQPMKQKRITKSDLHSKGFAFYEAGNFKKALPFFERAYSNNLLSADEKILLASLLIQEDKMSKALIIKNELLDSPSFKQKNGVLLDSLLAYYQKDYSHFKNKLEKFIKNSQNKSSIDIALLNLALFNWETRNYKKSIDYLDQLLTRGFDRNIVFYLTALNLLSQKKLDELEAYIIEDLSLEKNTFIKEFKQEFYFLLAYIYMKKQDKQKLNSYITKLLNEDPFLYQEYSYSSFIAKNHLFNWNYFYIHCREIFDFAKDNSLFKALYGFCYLKANNLKPSANYIKQAVNAEAQNPLFLALHSYLIMTEDNDAFQLKQIFPLINYKETIFPLPFILKARFLENQEEWADALSVWKQLLSFNPNNLSGVAGVAFNNYQLGDTAVGNIYAKKTLAEYPYYVKILSYTK
ncbi:MAG: hypothetical protein OXJ52_06950, partial [Oligoflexia bacterium]|nr:hypothetical protein [Oligoflexia bacterium]